MFGTIVETIHDNKQLELLIVIDAGTRLVGKCRHTGKEYLLNRDLTPITDEDLEEERKAFEKWKDRELQKTIDADMQKMVEDLEDLSVMDEMYEDFMSDEEFQEMINM